LDKHHAWDPPDLFLLLSPCLCKLFSFPLLILNFKYCNLLKGWSIYTNILIWKVYYYTQSFVYTSSKYIQMTFKLPIYRQLGNERCTIHSLLYTVIWIDLNLSKHNKRSFKA
jgi:hypothetical protein